MPLDLDASATLDEDVLDEETAIEDTQQDIPPGPRELAMEAIELANRARLDRTKDFPETSQDAADQVAEQLAEPRPLVPTENQTVLVKIDGQEQEVSLSDVLRSYQKGAAADRRLEEATRLLNEAKQAQAAPLAAPAPPAVPSPQEPSGEVEDFVRGALDKMFEGEQDAAVRALTSAIKAAGGSQPTPTPISIDEIAVQLQQRIAVDKAFETVRQEYPDIIANKDIELLTSIKINERVAAGEARADAMLTAAQEVYAILGKQPTSARREGTKTDEKLARKAALDPLRSAGVAASSGAADEFNTSPSAIIRAMAASRPGSNLAVGGR